MGWERFYTAKSLEDTGKTVDEVEWSRRPDLTFYFLDAKGDKVQIDPEDGSFSPMWVPMSTCRFLLNSSRVANVRSRNSVVVKALNACARNTGRVVSNGIGDCYSDGVYFLEKAYKVAGTPAKAKGLVRRARESVSDVAKYYYADDGDKATMSKCLADIDKAASSPTEDTIKEARWTCEKARAKADGGSPRRTFWNACARNGAYDTLEIRKDPRYGNNWCIYQEGVNVRAVSRVFDTPQSAKKYIREQMPAWADAKIRVKNACGTARNAGDRDMYEDAIRQAIVKCEAAIKYEPDADDYSDVTRIVKQAKDLLAKAYREI